MNERDNKIEGLSLPKERRGFTLIELLVIIAHIAFIAKLNPALITRLILPRSIQHFGDNWSHYFFTSKADFFRPIAITS